MLEDLVGQSQKDRPLIEISLAHIPNSIPFQLKDHLFNKSNFKKTV